MVCRVRCWLVRLILVCFPLAASTYGHGQATLPDAGGGKHILTRVSIWPMHSIYASSSICVIRSYDVFGHAQLRTAFLFPPQTDPIMSLTQSWRLFIVDQLTEPSDRSTVELALVHITRRLRGFYKESVD